MRRGRRGGRRRVVKRRQMSGRQIQRALTSTMRFRGKLFAATATGQTQSAFPITLRIPTNTDYTSGVVFFDPIMTLIMKNTKALSAASTIYSNFDYRDLIYSRNWIVCKVKNIALTPCYLKIYDVFSKEDQAYTKIADATQDTIQEKLYTDILASLTAAVDPTILATVLADSTMLPYSVSDTQMFLKSEGVFNSGAPLFKENWTTKKIHKVFLNPGQTYEWKVRPRQVRTPTNADSEDERMAFGGSTYIPLVMSRGDLGLSSGGVVGYTITELAYEFDYGTSIYSSSGTAGVGTQVRIATFPSNTAISAPGDDVDVS